MGDDRSRSDTQFLAMVIGIPLLIAVIPVLLWNAAPEVITSIMLGLDWVQLHLIRLTRGLHGDGLHYLELINSYFAGNVSQDTVQFGELAAISERVGGVMRFPMVVIMLGMIAIVIKRTRATKYDRKFSLYNPSDKKNSFIHYQAEKWPIAFAKIVPSAKRPVGLRNSRDPHEWLRDNNITIVENRTKARLEPEELKTKRAFAKQLGKKWSGFQRLPIHTQAIAIMCAMNVSWHDDREDIRRIVGEIMVSKKGADRKKALMNALKPYATKSVINQINKIGNQHQYSTTAMYALLTWAQSEGQIFPSGSFNWLKGVDRTLWYTLNNVGRHVAHTECAGVYAHYLVEKATSAPAKKPHVDSAFEEMCVWIADRRLPAGKIAL